jgi:hypothetical protein
MASGFEMRVGNAEREATAAELREHYASGRLTLDELNERLDQVFAAKTRGDLDAPLRDLPSARPGGTHEGSWPGQSAGNSWNTGAGQGGAGQGGAGQGGAGQGGAGQRAGHAIGAVVAAVVAMSVLVTLGFLGLFGLGTGRPVGIVLILAGIALLRRLLFGRRLRRARACGPRRRRW